MMRRRLAGQSCKLHYRRTGQTYMPRLVLQHSELITKTAFVATLLTQELFFFNIPVVCSWNLKTKFWEQICGAMCTCISKGSFITKLYLWVHSLLFILWNYIKHFLNFLVCLQNILLTSISLMILRNKSGSNTTWSCQIYFFTQFRFIGLTTHVTTFYLLLELKYIFV